MSSNYGRPCGEGLFPVDIKSVLELCSLYDATIDDFEKVLWIEENAFPGMHEEYMRKVKESMKKSTGEKEWPTSHTG